ncbi:MAG: PhzF family phenazine biosynthesis protein [Nocardioidaceae bacterium]
MAERRLHYEIVDVFTDRPFAGNPLAVVHEAAGLSTQQLLAIAREFNLSETTFPVPLSDTDLAAGADYRVRIFTPEREIPFAGHPTLGTAWTLLGRNEIGAGMRIQACGAGLIDVQVPANPLADVSLSAVPRDEARELSVEQCAAVAESVGLTGADVVGPAYVAGCGLTWLYLQVTDEAVSRARPGGRRVDELELGQASLIDPLDGVNVYAVANAPAVMAEAAAPAVMAEAREALRIHSRVFVPGLGIPEDPATGSAAVGLGLVLVASGVAGPVGQTAYEIKQGGEMGRPSTLHGRVEARAGRAVRCHLAGRVVHVATGTIAVPPA